MSLAREHSYNAGAQRGHHAAADVAGRVPEPEPGPELPLPDPEPVPEIPGPDPLPEPRLPPPDRDAPDPPQIAVPPDRSPRGRSVPSAPRRRGDRSEPQRSARADELAAGSLWGGRRGRS
jgi:hypothetical protein